MSAPSFPAFPELAGLCTYAEAARVGYSVEESVRRLVRFYWMEKRLSEIAVARLPATPEWEVKCALALHQWLDGEHADALRRRITEMRSPPPPLDRAPDPALDAFLDEVLRAHDTTELLAGLRLAHAELASAYRAHLAATNPLVDHPSRRVLRTNVQEEDEMLAWLDAAVAAQADVEKSAGERAASWTQHLEAWLAAAGSVTGVEAVPTTAPPPSRATGDAAPDTRPRRDRRFHGRHAFDFPPQTVYNAPDVPADERNLALLCRRTLEMDVPETMASFMSERRDRPWSFYREYGRQLWDEARHAMMGSVALHARGVDWTRIPLNIGFSLRLACHADPLERQILLYAIEQSLMAADTGKRFEYETAREADDALSAHFHDFDWADEVLHAQIGRRWMQDEGITVREALARGAAIHEKTWAALREYPDPDGVDTWAWWRAFVREVLGRESVAMPPAEDRPTIVQSGG